MTIRIATASFLAGFLLVLALIAPWPGGAHNTNYCGHGSTYWQRWSYGQLIYYRESFLNDYMSGGIHWHEVGSYYKNSPGAFYIYIHTHARSCPKPV